MKRIALLLALLPAPLLAAVPADFRFGRDLSGLALDAPRLVEVPLDAAIMAATRPGFPDLRVFDGAPREIPCLAEPLFSTHARTERQLVAAKTLDFREIPGNRIEARYDLEPDAPAASAIEIRTALRDFIRTVRVSGSEDGQFWRPIAEAEIFDYASFMGIRRTEIALPANACRHFAVEISNPSAERAAPLVRLAQESGRDPALAGELLEASFRVSELVFWHDVEVVAKDEPVLQEWPPVATSVYVNRRERITDVVLDVRGAPISRIELATTSRNFNRIATIQIPATIKGRAGWRSIADKIISQVELAGYSTNNLTIDFPEQRVERLRLVIQNTDDPPLELTGLRAFGPTYRLLWQGEPGATYRLAYGNRDVPAPAFDLAPLRAALQSGATTIAWELAAPSADEWPPAVPRSPGFTRALLIGALMVAAALALAAYRIKRGA